MYSCKSFGAASDSGLFFVPELCGAVESMPTLGGFGGAVSALSDSERHRLVKESKSPTSLQSPLNAKIFQNLRLERTPKPVIWLDKSPAKTPKNTEEVGAFSIIEKRDWSNEYRIRTQVDGTVKQSPPDNTGDRVTEMLTNRGARKIAESCEYMATKRGGFSTFLTLTLDAEARKRIEQKVAVGSEYIEAEFLENPKDKFREIEQPEINYKDLTQHIKTEFVGAHTPIKDGPYCPINYENKSTIQKEVSRFFDAMQKMYQRGWQYQENKKPYYCIEGKAFTKKEKSVYTKIKFAGSYKFKGSKAFYCVLGEEETKAGNVFTKLKYKRKPLDFLWVAECPDSISRETGLVDGVNPHVHVLMRYRVPYQHFRAWAKRVEKIWGQGMATLEKIKDGEKAGSYMAKAAGYLCKAQGKDKNDQGVIKGNRYNISKGARAPDWVCVGRHELGRMGFLLSEAAENFENNYGYLKKKREHLKKKLDSSVGKDRQKIGAILENTRQVIKNLPRLNKYQAILKGDYQFNEFMNWAANDAPVSGHAWLPDKAENEGFKTKLGRGHWLQEYTQRRGLRRSKRHWMGWLEYQQQINEYIFNGEVLRPCFEQEMLAMIEEKEDFTSDYNEWAANDAPKIEGLMYG